MMKMQDDIWNDYEMDIESYYDFYFSLTNYALACECRKMFKPDCNFDKCKRIALLEVIGLRYASMFLDFQ